MDGAKNVKMGDSDGEEEITMPEFLKEQEELEKESNVVLGGSDATNCNYNLGYVSRQALYACSTCTNTGTKPAGICLACSLECHDGHELVELYTKRNFRCDCGNSRLKDTKCKLCPAKADENSENAYNHNFRGLYCICDRPYPDHEDEVEDEMIQCIICEDWYHGRHLGSTSPANDDYEEMICDGCMQKHEFLWHYTLDSKENVKVKKEDGSEDNKPVDVEKHNPEKKEVLTECSSSADASAKVGVNDSTKQTPEAQQDSSAKAASPEVKETTAAKTEGASASSETATDGSCTLEELKCRKVERKSGSTFWLAGWRNKLCTCVKCKSMYEAGQLMFLLDESDPVHVYESKAPQRQSSQYEQGMEALSRMNRVEQVEAIHGYNDMKSELSQYLKRFAENGKVVRAEDIKEFFSQMAARKRQKTGSGMQYFCK